MVTNKTQFNREFHLSLDGKFKGVDCVNNQSLFFHKLNKALSCQHGRYKRSLVFPLVFRCSGQTCKIYIY